MITKSDSYHRIIEVYDGLSRQQKKMADGIINRYDEIEFFSITQLASFLGVSEATIVRFAQHLGHKGFPELKKDLINYYREYLTPGERMRRSIEEFPDDPLLYKSHAARDIQLLQESLLAVDNDSFSQAVEAIVKADRIYLFGNGENECLASHLAFRLSRFKLKATPVGFGKEPV
jgi:DNA-binding MurR/RpiR family transcriptional regulator